MLPQLPEPATQCGLRHGQKARGDADVAMLVDRVENHQVAEREQKLIHDGALSPRIALGKRVLRTCGLFSIRMESIHPRAIIAISFGYLRLYKLWAIRRPGPSAKCDRARSAFVNKNNYIY